MFSGPSLSARLSNIQHMPVLITATIASDKPTDGYLVKDIIKMSFESSQTRVFLQQYLLNQLVTSRNVYVKRKVLKLIEELLEKGHIEFKQNLRKQPEPLNEAARLRIIRNKDGGLMSECGRIRDLANKVLEMLYSDTPELRTSRPTPELTVSNSDTSKEGSSSGSRIEGFGSTSQSGKVASFAGDKLKTLFGTGSRPAQRLVYDTNYATMDPVPHNVGGGVRGHPGVTGVGRMSERYHEQDLPAGAPHRTGEAGGGWGSNNLTTPTSNPPQEILDNNTHDSPEESTEQERKLVEDIVAPGGVKAAPPREELNRFISRCKVLNCLAVVEFLRQKLLETDSQVVLRALFVMEALLRSNTPDISSILDLTLEELNTLSQSHNPTIRAKATKILRLLAATANQKHISSNAGSDPNQAFSTDTSSETLLDIIRGTGGGGGEGGGGGGGEEREEEEEELTEQHPADIFSGMLLTGQQNHSTQVTTAMSAVHPTHSLKKATLTRGRSDLEDKREDRVSFDALLGPSPSEASYNNTPNQLLNNEGDLLMNMGDDDKEEEFDPLKQTETISNSSLTNSLLGGQNAPLTAPPRHITASDTIMSELSGLSLTSSQPTTTEEKLAPLNPQVGEQLSTLPPQFMSQVGSLQPSPLAPSTLSQSTPFAPSTLSQFAPPQPDLTPQPRVAGMQGGFRGQSGGVGVAYMPGMMLTYPTPPRAGVSPQGMQMYSAASNMAFMNQFGGEARPVQRPLPTDQSAAESGFDFLSKSSKASAFDFVKDEISNAKKK